MLPALISLWWACARAGSEEEVVSRPVPEPVVQLEIAACPTTVGELPEALFVDRSDERLRAHDLVVVLKSAKRLLHFRSGALLDGQCWPIALAHDPVGHVGHKEREGDLRTPEGWYRTSDKPSSRYYAAIAVHYPNLADADAGLARGAITKAQRDAIATALARDAKPPQTTPLGGEILVHGGGSGSDWTLGCVALDDDAIDALRATLPQDVRVDVLILP